jgi:adenylate cyclase
MDGHHPQRRSGSIVCMDMVGYSSLMASDEAGTVAALREFHNGIIAPGVADYGGRLSGRAGDSWLIEFTEPEPALRFSLDVLQALRRPRDDQPLPDGLQVRIGINCGEYVEDDGILHGTSVNVAARLQAIAKPGGISVSADIRQQVGDRVPCQFREIGPRAVKNIPSPVYVFRVLTDADDNDDAAPELIDLSHVVPGMGNRPAIAVLPFRNIGSDPDQEYFSDGLTEDIINGLARFRWFPVISRNSTFQFKNSPLDLREIGSRLGARYIVEGSVRRAGNRLRATAHLTGVEDGLGIWSERYDRELTDLFLVQDEIAQSLIATLEPELSRAEELRTRTRSLEQLGDWELVRRGMWHQNRLTRADAAMARQLFDQALARNPDSVEAMVQLSWWHFWDVWAQRGPMEGWVDMERLARQAMAVDPKDARGFMLAGTAQVMQGDVQEGRDLLQQAIHLNPSFSRAYANMATSYLLAGDPEQALEPIGVSLRLSPNDGHIFHNLGEKAAAHYMMGEFREAVASAEESLRHRGGYVYAHVIRIGALARWNRSNEARQAMAAFLNRRPNFTVGEIEWLPFIDRHWITYLIDGLRLAGYH